MYKQSAESDLFVFLESDVGKIRTNNEDNFVVDNIINTVSEKKNKHTFKLKCDDYWLCLGVFDGMGGAENGELASLFAAQIFKAGFCNIKRNCDYQEIDDAVRRAFFNANRRIVEERVNRPVCGTTGTVIMTDGIVFKIYHIGDSRAYLYRNSVLYQLTQDQTVAELKRRAGFDEEDILEVENHQLTEFIGADESLTGLTPIESKWMELKSEDKVLLCTDGLSDMCSGNEIIQILRNIETSKVVHFLINKALDKGGKDNITCLLLSKAL